MSSASSQADKTIETTPLEGIDAIGNVASDWIMESQPFPHHLLNFHDRSSGYDGIRVNAIFQHEHKYAKPPVRTESMSERYMPLMSQATYEAYFTY